MNPYKVEGPASISFSGGRTSGFMLKQIIEAYDGTLPSDIHVVFANTGKEEEATLDFVRDVAKQFQVRIRWLEYVPATDAGEGSSFREVAYETASRKGEPFDALIATRMYLPNPVTRFCTQQLKIMVIKNFMWKSLGFEHWTSILGLRADEPHRVHRINSGIQGSQRWDVACPMFVAEHCLDDVEAFWKTQDFDLKIPRIRGNCDLCFLKGKKKILTILRQTPDLADWWIAKEQSLGKTFRKDVSMEKLLEIAKRPGLLPWDDFGAAEESLDCGCTD